MRQTARVAVFAVGAFGVGCGSSGTVTDAGADSGPPPDSGSGPQTPITVWRNTDDAVADAEVRVLAGDGTVLADVTTDSNGKAMLPYTFGNDFVWVVVTKDGYGTEVEGFDKTAVDLWRASITLKPNDPMPFWTFPTGALVNVTGKVTGLANANDKVTLVSTAMGNYDGVPASYTLREVSGHTATVVGVEHSGSWVGRTLAQPLAQWFQLEHAPVTAPTTLDLDLSAASKLTPSKLKVHLEVTGGANGPLGGASVGYLVTQAGVNAPVVTGVPSASAPNADSSAFDLDVESVDPPKVTGPRWAIAYIFTGQNAFSMRTLDALPKDGDTVTGFEVPMTVPAKQLWADPVAFTGAPTAADAWVNLAVLRANGDIIIRFMLPARHATPTLTLPKVPDDVMATVPATALAQIFGMHGDLPAIRGYTSAYVTASRRFTIAR